MTQRAKRLILEMTPVFANADHELVRDFFVRHLITDKFMELGRSYLKVIDECQDHCQYFRNQGKEATRQKNRSIHRATRQGEILKGDLRMYFPHVPRIIDLVESVKKGILGQKQVNQAEPTEQTRQSQRISWERARIHSYLRLVRGLRKLEQEDRNELAELEYDLDRLDSLEVQFEQALAARIDQDEAVASRSIHVKHRDEYIAKLARWRTAFKRKVRYGLQEEPESMHRAIRRLLNMTGSEVSVEEDVESLEKSEVICMELEVVEIPVEPPSSKEGDESTSAEDITLLEGDVSSEPQPIIKSSEEVQDQTEPQVKILEPETSSGIHRFSKKG